MSIRMNKFGGFTLWVHHDVHQGKFDFRNTPHSIVGDFRAIRYNASNVQYLEKSFQSAFQLKYVDDKWRKRKLQNNPVCGHLEKLLHHIIY